MQTNLCIPSQKSDSSLNQPASQTTLKPSILPPSPTPPSSFLPTLPLFHLPPLRRLSFLQPLHPLRLPRSRLIRHILPPNLQNQGVQSAKASVGVISLLPRIVRLDNQRIRLWSMVSRGQERLAQDGREEGEDGGCEEAEGGF